MDGIYLSATQLNMINNINKVIDSGFGLLEVSNDTDTENEINPIDCKYYTTDQFNDKNSIKYISILHLNIHSLEHHKIHLNIALKYTLT